jgi:hypothetical protein
MKRDTGLMWGDRNPGQDLKDVARSGRRRYRTKKEHLHDGAALMDCLAELRAREEEVSREWQWLHDALNSVARDRAENGDAAAFRLMQAQAMRLGQRRIELSLRIAEMEGPAGSR